MKARLPRWAASMLCSRRMSPSYAPRPSQTVSMRDATARRAPTATACWRGRRAPRWSAAHALHWSYGVDVESLHECAALLIGTHDFTAFTPTDTYHVRFDRDVYAAYWRARDHELLEFWIEADTFMRHMNRALVGTMLEVARGRLLVDDFAQLLEGAAARAAGPTAPAHGLHFAGAGYGGERLLRQSAKPD